MVPDSLAGRGPLGRPRVLVAPQNLPKLSATWIVWRVVRLRDAQPANLPERGVVWRVVGARAPPRSRLSERQPDVEAGRARVGVHRDRPVVAVDDDAVRRRQAEADPVADVLGREERVEYALADLRRDAGPVVGDVHPRAARLAARGDGDRALPVERVDRVVEQVGPDLVEL